MFFLLYDLFSYPVGSILVLFFEFIFVSRTPLRKIQLFPSSMTFSFSKFSVYSYLSWLIFFTRGKKVQYLLSHLAILAIAKIVFNPINRKKITKTWLQIKGAIFSTNFEIIILQFFNFITQPISLFFSSFQ